MATRNIQMTYSGGTVTPIQRTITNSGQSYYGVDTICATGPSTTTISPPIILNPTTGIRCYAMQASGNCSVLCDVGGTDTTITLTANVPEIQTEAASGSIAGLPSGADTMTLKIFHTNSTTITFTCDMLIE